MPQGVQTVPFQDDPTRHERRNLNIKNSKFNARLKQYSSGIVNKGCNGGLGSGSVLSERNQLQPKFP